MRRADRLFQIVQLLRGHRVVTASELARALEVSPRTIYRDVQDLIASGVPIEGEAGVGYCLPRGFDLPPLMFDEDEIGALVLGARMVQAWGDTALAARARSLLAKVETVLPERLKPRLAEVELYVPLSLPGELRTTLECLRRGIDQHRKTSFRYVDSSGVETARTVRPLCLVFWGTVWTASAWCELRRDFRTFRPDRMLDVALTDEPFTDEPGKDLASFRTRVWSIEPYDEPR
jgi:predicted DNA-binding transcriptional regulator YafY